jgi:hypothetical protein
VIAAVRPGLTRACRRAPVEVLVDFDQLDRAQDLWRFAVMTRAEITLQSQRLCASSQLRPATRFEEAEKGCSN